MNISIVKRLFVRMALPLAFFAGASAHAQTRRESLVWLAYFGTFEINPRWSVSGEFHERRWTDPFRVHQRVWRAHVFRRLTPAVTVGTGYSYFLQGSPAPTDEPLPLVGEQRPHVQMDVRHRLSLGIGINQRVRAEYRATPQTEGGRAQDGYVSAGRVRYRVGVDLPVSNRQRGPVIRASNEYHVMFGDRPISFDQNRVQVGVDVPVTPSLSIETAYLWWYQRRKDSNILERDYLRVTLNHRIRRRSSI